jgi:hypothetical protein
MSVVARDARHDPFVRLVERHEVRFELDVERAVDAAGPSPVRLVCQYVPVEQSPLDWM